MKTLDEVIEKIEKMWVCPSSDEAAEYCDFMEVKEDALHYLKEYRTTQTAYIKAMADIEDNPPLTWDELRQMVGKPVWVEILSDEIDLSSRWMMVARETKAHSLPLAYTDDMGHWIYGHEDDLGKTWQAYRKERG